MNPPHRFASQDELNRIAPQLEKEEKKSK